MRLENLKGRKFYQLTVKKFLGTTPSGNGLWRCKCDCGMTVDKPAQYLKRSKIASCGCAKRVSERWQDLTGNRYGRLTVLGLDHKNKRGEDVWRCKCYCGSVKTYLGTAFKYGKTKSCGCLHKEVISGTNNYQARRMMAENDGIYISSQSHWYIKAEGIIKRCREEGIPYGFESKVKLAAYLKDIAPETCPVFGYKLHKACGDRADESFSVDRIIPSKGYVKGNIQVISWMANRMKSDAPPERLKQFAEWVLSKC